ncbi:DUF1631 family protein [Pseudomaricurvus sp. HS19]|uniref:DUF1631 family protein n=1 Tax=Pseudomaricurvus sp. HS19 TaxID=2692626 RepID=UPI00137095E4|nr:DUF1631 family protein [Pseudomaricurvus sp. HS19]MYM64717.1 DUF1631 family protein [Pseudomaricurvus sp. HS19]
MSDPSPQILTEVPAFEAMQHLPAPVLRLRDNAVRLLTRAFNNLFLGSDDVLFRLAAEAGSSEEQNAYFEYLREIRLQRTTLVDRYMRTLDQAFARVCGLAVAPQELAAVSATQVDVPTFESIELALALETSVSAVQKQSSATLQALIAVTNQWLPVPVSVRNFPLGPRVLCDSFRMVAESLQMDGRGRQILGKLFDKAVVQQLERIYQRLQEVLRSSELAAAAIEMDASALAKDPHTVESAIAGAVTREQLLQVLTELQRSDAQRLVAGSPLESQTLEHLQRQIQQLSGQAVEVAASDWQAIELMQKMFEFIVRDQSLPPPMQALLRGLHIPLLKVAVLDDAVFSEAGHCARRLLNELANAALGWQEGEDSGPHGLFTQVQNCVVYLLLNFTEEVAVIQQALDQFHGSREQESRRASLLERRTIDAEDGKAAGERARRLVDAELHPYLASGQLPTCVAELLQEAWHKVMLVTLLKQGATSDDWYACRQTVELLVWSVTAPMDGEGRAKLLQTLPDLLTRLRQGLDLIAMDAGPRSRLLDQLQQTHLQRLSGDEGSGTAVAGSPVLADSAPVAGKESRDEGDSVSAGHLARVDRVAKGSWFEVRAEGADPCRCRLAAVISSVDKYIFVDRSGVKVSEKSRREFARALQSGEFVVLDDGMLFDRALSSVIGDVRRGRGRS